MNCCEPKVNTHTPTCKPNIFVATNELVKQHHKCTKLVFISVKCHNENHDARVRKDFENPPKRQP